MSDTVERSIPVSSPDRQRWLLLIHQIPPKPDYFRVRVGRRLQRIGAVAIKNSVYVLPASERAAEEFLEVLREIMEGGGEGSLCSASFIGGLSDPEIKNRFLQARSQDYAAIASDAQAVLKAHGRHRIATERHNALKDSLAKLRKRFAAVAMMDFFESEPRRRVAQTLDELEKRLMAPLAGEARSEQDYFRGRTWVTREGLFVDRIASAWLIQRFIDPAARFKFVAPLGFRVSPGELRFDMVGAEYTHEGDRCTFETLVHRFRLDDSTLTQIAEIVHDIDLKDGKFGREDAVGIERVLAGIAVAHSDDTARLARGGQLFDELYALLRREAQSATPTVDDVTSKAIESSRRTSLAE